MQEVIDLLGNKRQHYAILITCAFTDGGIETRGNIGFRDKVEDKFSLVFSEVLVGEEYNAMLELMKSFVNQSVS